MIDLRKLAIPALIAISGSLLAACGDTEPTASPTPTMSDDAMMEEDVMEDDTMEEDTMEDDATEEDTMEEDSMEEDA
jgi:pentapeptide MXKDX repeat protein